jgi:hypothetical protein
MQYQKLNVFDERFLEKEPVVKMYRGASETSRNVASVVGGTINQNQVQFNVPIIPSNYVDRYPMLKTTFSFAVNALNNTKTPGANPGDPPVNTAITAGNQIIVPGVDVSMAPYPFTTNCISTAEVVLNGTQVCSYDMGKYAKMLLRISEIEENMKHSTCPSCPELTFASIDDAMLTMSNSQSSFNDATNNYIPNGSWSFSTVSTTVYNCGTSWKSCVRCYSTNRFHMSNL